MCVFVHFQGSEMKYLTLTKLEDVVEILTNEETEENHEEEEEEEEERYLLGKERKCVQYCGDEEWQKTLSHWNINNLIYFKM